MMESVGVLIVCALLLDAALGEPAWLWSRLPHPAVLMGRLIGWLERRLNKGHQRRLRGLALAGFLLLCGFLIGTALAAFGPVMEVVVAAILLAQRSLVQHVAAVATALRQNLADARNSVAMIVSRDTSNMDASAVARAAIESGSENLSDGIIAPALWFLVGGLPGLVTYKFINTADSMIGYRTPRYEAFGWASARLDDLLNLVPARLTALLIALPTGQIELRSIRADARLHRSPNAGWPEAAMSRALGISLAGPRSYDGQLRDFPWVNESGRKTLTAVDIDHSIVILWKAWGVMLVICAVSSLLFA
jgi:adenosylcobinamide-phosphate synthase